MRFGLELVTHLSKIRDHLGLAQLADSVVPYIYEKMIFAPKASCEKFLTCDAIWENDEEKVGV